MRLRAVGLPDALACAKAYANGRGKAPVPAKTIAKVLAAGRATIKTTSE
jgi:hypothetical protein